VAEAKALVAKYNTPQPSTWEGPTSAPKPKPGMTVAVVSSAQVVEGSKRLSAGALAGAKALGWKVIFCDGKGEPAVQQQCTQSALQQGAKGIIWSAVDPTAAGAALAEARKAHVPVVTTYDYGGSSAALPAGVIADVSTDQCLAGKLNAAYMIANAPDGKPKVAMVTGNEYPIVKVRAECSKKALEEAGATIVSSQEIRAAEVATKASSMASALLQQHPSGQLEYIWAPYDAAGLFLANGIESGGRSDVKVVGFDANAPNLQLIAKGGGEAATVGSVLEWAGWGAVDELVRSFAGAPLVKSYGISQQLYTKANAAHPATPLNYEAKFREIWGVG
jgi:ribose transport system substrate-binding protein